MSLNINEVSPDWGLFGGWGVGGFISRCVIVRNTSLFIARMLNIAPMLKIGAGAAATASGLLLRVENVFVNHS